MACITSATKEGGHNIENPRTFARLTNCLRVSLTLAYSWASRWYLLCSSDPILKETTQTKHTPDNAMRRRTGEGRGRGFPHFPRVLHSVLYCTCTCCTCCSISLSQLEASKGWMTLWWPEQCPVRWLGYLRALWMYSRYASSCNRSPSNMFV